MTVKYDPATDTFNPGTGKYEVPQDAPAFLTDQEVRFHCLGQAIKSTKLGLAHDAIKQADRYYRFVTGRPDVDQVASLSFVERLDGLVQEFLRDERSDARRLVQDMAEYAVKLAPVETEVVGRDLDGRLMTAVKDKVRDRFVVDSVVGSPQAEEIRERFVAGQEPGSSQVPVMKHKDIQA